MKFCSACGNSVELRIPDGDNRPRHICTDCGEIHYRNPTVVAGCIAHWGQKVLLCRRAIEPRYGYWTLPAGFMELGESAAVGAAREAHEEANAIINHLTLYSVYSVVHISQVHIMYRGELKDGAASAGSESLEVKLFDEHEIPWSELAFPIIGETLKCFFSERQSGHFAVHHGEISRSADGEIHIQRF